MYRIDAMNDQASRPDRVPARARLSGDRDRLQQLEAHSILVKEYGPGVTPHFAEPVTGVVRINGATWTVYHRHFALRRTFSDGVTVMIEGDGYASTNALEILASGIR